MKQQLVGTVCNLVKDNQPVAGCTISNQLYTHQGVTVLAFSLAAKTSISPEANPNRHLLTVDQGELTVFDNDGHQWQIKTGQSFFTQPDSLVGMKAAADCIYTDIGFLPDVHVNPAVPTEQAFSLANLVPYQNGRIVNLDLVTNDAMKLVVMSFDQGTGLPEHSAPGPAMIFGLAGDGVVTYEGQPHHLKNKQTFAMAKDARHAVTAQQRFKMGLLVLTK